MTLPILTMCGVSTTKEIYLKTHTISKYVTWLILQMNKPEEIAKHAYCINDCVCKESINYVIADGGGLFKWKHYYIGMVHHMIALCHESGGEWIRNIISVDLQKKSNSFFTHVKLVESSFLGGVRGGCKNDYSITWEQGGVTMIAEWHGGVGRAQIIIILHNSTTSYIYVFLSAKLFYKVAKAFFDWVGLLINQAYMCGCCCVHIADGAHSLVVDCCSCIWSSCNPVSHLYVVFSRGGPFKAKQYPADLCSLLQKKAINNFDIGSCVWGGGEGS